MNNNLKLAPKLINDFGKFLKNRTTYFLVPESLSEILALHIQVWSKDMEWLNNSSDVETREKWAAYYQFHNLLNSIISLSEERVLTERTIDAWGFFDRLRKHVDKYKNDKVILNNGERFYAEDILSVFYDTFFKNITGSTSEFDIWNHYFPSDWKVRKSNFENSEGILARITFNHFLDYANKKIIDAKEKDFDVALNEASENLFPELDPVRWAKILIFVLSPYEVREKVKNVIHRPWTFGFASRMREFGSHVAINKEEFEKEVEVNMRSMDNLEKEKTFEFVDFLCGRYGIFQQTFTIENLEYFIRDAKSLQFPSQSFEERKRISLLELFSEMLIYFKQHRKSKEIGV